MRAYLIGLIMLGCFILETGGQEPTRWRGSQSSGKYDETGLLRKWPESGPEILWTYTSLGKGHSSAVVSGGSVFTSGMIDSTGYLFKFDMSGNLKSKYAYGFEFTQSFYGTRATPVIAGNLAYILSGRGLLVCMDHNTGEILWKKDLTRDFDGEVIRWGYNETPVVDGDKIYCTPGGRKYNVVALNRFNGNLIWSCKGRGELSAYCTPLLFEHNGRKLLATHTASHLICIDPEMGKMLWSHPQSNKWSVHANTPIYHNGGLFYFSGYGQGAGKLELNQDGTSASLSWKNSRFDSRMGGAVFVDGYIYGSGDFSKTWQAVDWETGKSQYDSTNIAKGTVIYADGLLYCYSDRGELAIAKADPKEFRIISQTKVKLGSEQHWAHTMIHKGVLYVRHGQALIAYRIKE